MLIMIIAGISCRLSHINLYSSIRILIGAPVRFNCSGSAFALQISAHGGADCRCQASTHLKFKRTLISYVGKNLTSMLSLRKSLDFYPPHPALPNF
jgi:hypothetical protein